jgi:hypothetical protein
MLILKEMLELKMLGPWDLSQDAMRAVESSRDSDNSEEPFFVSFKFRSYEYLYSAGEREKKKKR